MAGWISPTGNVANSWVNPTYAYDEDTGIVTTRNVPADYWSTYLELTHASLQCSKVRIWTTTSVVNFSTVQVDVYYGAAWHNIYSGGWTVSTWLECPIGSTQAVTSMQVRFYNIHETLTKTCNIAEADFYEEAEAAILLSLTEGLKAGDTPSRLMTAGLSLTEGLKGGESFVRAMTAGLSITEGLKGGESFAQLSQAFPVTTEGLKAGDTPTRSMVASLSVTEGLKGGDSFDKTALMSLLASDGLKGGDTPALLAQMLPVLSEGIKLGESLSIQLGTLQQSFYPITPVEVTPGTAGSWQDVDVSAYVPAGATGVILHCVNNSTDTMRYFGFRKNGSTDARTDSLSYTTHCWAMIGVDSSRIFEAYIQNITDLDVWLVGYTTSGVTFFTNAYDKSPSVLSNWEDIDCSTEAPNAIGLIFEIQNTGSLASFGLRKYGSSDNRVVQTVGYNTFAAIIGCDSSQKCQGQIADSNIKVYLVGYVTQGAIFNTNATDVSLSSTGSWIDLAALPTGSVMGFIEATSLASTNRFGLRENGSSEAIYKYCYRHPFAMVECDSSGIIEGEISNTDVDFFLVGYAVSSLVLIITLTDGLKAGESLSLNVVMPKTLADGFKVGDSSVLNILRYLALTDGIKLGDSPLAVIVKLLFLLDGLKAGDTIAVAMTAGKTLTDGLKLGDLPTELSQAWLSLAEGGKFGDSEIIDLIGVMYYLTLADGLKLGDSTLRTLTALLQLVDGFKLGDVPLYSTIGELLMAWALAQSYYYVTTEVKPYFQITTEAKSYFDTTTRTGVE